jgi:hypothetical protein
MKTRRTRDAVAGSDGRGGVTAVAGEEGRAASSSTLHREVGRAASSSTPQRSCRIWNARWDNDFLAPPTDPSVHWDSALVGVATSAPHAELFIDGETLGVVAVPALGIATWQLGGGRFHTPAPGSNLTAVCAGGAVHTIIAPGVAAGLRLILDAPTARTGTGTALLLNGQDVALVRAEVVDAKGRVVTGGSNNTINITFSVTDGPGRIVATHNGDQRCHTPNLALWHHAFHGLVRAVVQVTHNAAGADALRRRLVEIDAEGGSWTTVSTPGSRGAAVDESGIRLARPVPTTMTVSAASPGLGAASMDISLSTDAEVHSVLAAAAAVAQ